MCIRFINKKPKLQEKEVTITENTTTTVTPDTGKDGLSSVEITTNVPTPTPVLQSKSVTITENTTTTVTPDTGKDGLSSVEITTNVSGSDFSEYFQSDFKGNSSPGIGIQYGIASTIKKIPITLNSTDSNLNYAFYSAANLIESPLINIQKNSTKLNSTFQDCTSLQTVQLFDTSKVTSMEGTFRNCSSLETIPLFDTSHVTSFTSCLANTKIETFPAWNMSSGVVINYVFSGCTELKNVPILNWSSATNLTGIFNSCAKLTTTSLDNILQSCITATQVSNKTLSNMGFNSTNYPSSTIEALPHYQDFLDAGWTIGY